jgi:hypothetical protein
MNERERPEGLPLELASRPDGHLSELALTAVADGEADLLPVETREHLDGCGACQARLGDAALLAVVSAGAFELEASEATATEALATLRAAADDLELVPGAGLAPVSSGRGRRPLPRGAIVLALGLAALGAAPSLLTAGGHLPTTLATLSHAVPIVLRTAVRLARGLAGSNSPALILALWAAALMLGLMGLWIARRSPHAAGELDEGELGLDEGDAT